MKSQPDLSTTISSEPIINLAYLQTRYPILFRALRYPRSYQCNLTYWGIECGEGWMPIIDKAAAEIELELKYLISKIKMKIELGDNDMQEWLEEVECKGMTFYELKENGYSPLIPYCQDIREYDSQLEIGIVNGHLCDTQTWERIRQIVTSSEEKSNRTCERCGDLGQLKIGWSVRVLCDNCNTVAKDARPLYLAEL